MILLNGLFFLYIFIKESTAIKIKPLISNINRLILKGIRKLKSKNDNANTLVDFSSSLLSLAILLIQIASERSKRYLKIFVVSEFCASIGPSHFIRLVSNKVCLMSENGRKTSCFRNSETYANANSKINASGLLCRKIPIK